MKKHAAKRKTETSVAPAQKLRRRVSARLSDSLGAEDEWQPATEAMFAQPLEAKKLREGNPLRSPIATRRRTTMFVSTAAPPRTLPSATFYGDKKDVESARLLSGNAVSRSHAWPAKGQSKNKRNASDANGHGGHKAVSSLNGSAEQSKVTTRLRKPAAAHKSTAKCQKQIDDGAEEVASVGSRRSNQHESRHRNAGEVSLKVETNAMASTPLHADISRQANVFMTPAGETFHVRNSPEPMDNDKAVLMQPADDQPAEVVDTGIFSTPAVPIIGDKSPGHCNGGLCDAASINSTAKRPRGRPRKTARNGTLSEVNDSTAAPVADSGIAVNNISDDSIAPSKSNAADAVGDTMQKEPNEKSDVAQTNTPTESEQNSIAYVPCPAPEAGDSYGAKKWCTVM